MQAVDFIKQNITEHYCSLAKFKCHYHMFE